MYWLTQQVVDRGYSKLFSEYEQLPSYTRECKHPVEEDLNLPDYATPLQRGWQWLFAGLQQHQPRTFAVLAKWDPLLLFGEAFSEGFFGKLYWKDLLLRLGDRYLVVRPEYRGDTYEEQGAEHVSASFLLAMPEPLANAYYARSRGIACEIEVPYPVVAVSRVLPHPAGRISSALTLVGERKSAQHAAAVALRRLTGTTGLSDQDLLKQFRLLLDTRHPDALETMGDLLFVQEGSPSRQVILVPQLDFSRASFLERPVEWMDEYVSRVLSFR